MTLHFVHKLVSPTLPYVPDRYKNINSTKSPSSGAGNGREPSLTSHRDSARSRVRLDRRVSAVTAVEVPVFVCLRSDQ